MVMLGAVLAYRYDVPRLTWLVAPAAIDLMKLGRTPFGAPKGFRRQSYRPQSGAGGWLRIRVRPSGAPDAGRWYVAFRAASGGPWNVYGALLSTGQGLVGVHLNGDLAIAPLKERDGACFETWTGPDAPEFAVFSRAPFSLTAQERVDGHACVRFEEPRR